jgi:diguanylate cyclase (GGDEF)-like protein
LAFLAILSGGCREHPVASSYTVADSLSQASNSADSTVFARVRGVISFADMQSGDCVVEDATAGIRVILAPRGKDIHTGQLVEVAGLLHVSGGGGTSGGSGTMLEPDIVTLGEAARPEPHLLSLDQLTDRFANRTVTVRATVESVMSERAGIQSIGLRGQGSHAISSVRLDLRADSKLIDAEIQLTGVLARPASPNAGPLIWTRNPDDLTILNTPPPGEGIPERSVNELLRIPRSETPAHRVRVKGHLTASTTDPSKIADGTGSIPVSLARDCVHPSGSAVDLVGFLNFADGSPHLESVELTVPPPEERSVIRTAAELHHMSAREAALSQPVAMRAVVTFAASPLLFIQDATDGAFVALKPGQREPATGDLIDIRGHTTAGEFAPGVDEAEIRVVGRRALPPPDPDFEAAFAGQRDCRWVRFEGVVQQVKNGPRESLVSLMWGVHAFKAHIAGKVDRNRLNQLLDREVSVRGVIGALFNNRRQLLGVQLFVPDSDFVQLKDAGAPPVPPAWKSISSLLQYAPAEQSGHRVLVQGTITLSNPEGPTWVQDSTGSLQILAHAKAPLAPGDVVAALGYPLAGSFGPVMRVAELTKVRSGPPPAPVRVSPEDAARGTYESHFVELEGKVVASAQRATGHVVTLRSGPYLFEARLPLISKQALEPVPPESKVLIRGIASVVTDRHLDTTVPRGFKILLRSAEDLVVVSHPPWLTTGRLVLIAGGSVAAVLAAFCWILLLQHSVRLKTRNLTEKAHELERANRIANDALQRAREAEATEADRKAILEFVAKDEPLDRTMRTICEAAARHLRIEACSLQLILPDGARIADATHLPQAAAASLQQVDFDQIVESQGFSPVVELSGEAGWRESARLFWEAGLNYYCCAPIRRNRVTAGWLIGFSAQRLMLEGGRASALETWSSMASLALERRGSFEQLSYRAQHDDLTGLMNRASWQERMELELAKSSLDGSGIAMIFLDLDGFKEINDRYGHDAGDEVLREVARRIKESVRGTDIAARVGGDEFVVALPGVGSRVEAERICGLVASAIARTIPFGAVELRAGVSFGIACFPSDGVRLEVLTKQADEDMYRMKGLGRKSPQLTLH